MKNLKAFVLLAAFVISAHIATAQGEATPGQPRSPKWISEKGYWVIESNIKTPKSSIVRFYTNDHHLIYTEKVEGVVLKVKKKKTLMNLKNVLEKVVYAWEKNGEVKDTGELLAVLGKK